MVKYENEVLNYLNLPKVPKKEWNGKDEFKRGVAVIELKNGDEAYAVAGSKSLSPNDVIVRVIKTFSRELFHKVNKVYVVPDYMDEDVENFDLDEQSKEKARAIIEEAHEQEMIDVEVKETPVENEWVFDEIHNRDEAEAYVRAYRKKHRVKGKCPTDAEALKAYLYVIASKIKK